EIREITPSDLDPTSGAVIVDVREADELLDGHIAGARAIPRGFLELKIENEVKDHARPIVVYCAGGTRSLLAADTLRRLGYQNVASLRGGFKAWKDAGRPYTVPEQKAGDDWFRRRYARHLSIPEVGEAGQRKLGASKVLLVGAGGLG